MSLGPFKDESTSFGTRSHTDYESSSEAKLARIQYPPLEQTELLDRDLEPSSPEQKQKALERYKLLSLIAKELNGGWSPKNLNPLIDKYSSQFSIAIISRLSNL